MGKTWEIIHTFPHILPVFGPAFLHFKYHTQTTSTIPLKKPKLPCWF